MSCYLWQQPPQAFLMDRRRSFPGEGQAKQCETESFDIGYDFVAALYNNVSTQSPIINDIFNTKLQEYELTHRRHSHGQLQQYRSNSSLSSNSEQSSRRQSFSSTASNSCCNNNTCGTSVSNYCTASTKNYLGQPYGSPQQNNYSGTKRFCSLLRARLLNMSEADEEPSNVKEVADPGNVNMSYRQGRRESEGSVLSEHICEEDCRGRRRSSSFTSVGSEGSKNDFAYPCVGPFEKKRRMAARLRGDRVSESSDAGSTATNASFDSLLVHPNSGGKQSTKRGISPSEDSIDQQQPVNLCKYDEDIAKGINSAARQVARMTLNKDDEYPIVIASADQQWAEVHPSPYRNPNGDMKTPVLDESGNFGPRLSPHRASSSSPQSGTSGSLYGQKHSPQPGTSSSFLHPELANPASLYHSPDIQTCHRSPGSGSSNSAQCTTPDSFSFTSSPSPYSLCPLAPIYSSQNTHASSAHQTTESHAKVARYLNFNTEPHAFAHYPSPPRIEIPVEDQFSSTKMRERSYSAARELALAKGLSEFRITEPEEVRAVAIEDHNEKLFNSPIKPQPYVGCRPILSNEYSDFRPSLEHEFQTVQLQLKSEEMREAELEVSKKSGPGRKSGGKKKGKTVHECQDCGKTFSQLRNFRYHRSKHDGTHLFECTCPVCGKNFNDKGYLSSHLKIHRNAKEYQCEYCDKNFNQRVAYNMHVRIHTGVKPHQCPSCEKAFSRKMLLRQHLRTHTGERPYSCNICNKAFADRSNMLLHQKLHSGSRPYACNQCDKTFSKNHHLKTHLNHHLGIKPYVCPNCFRKFTQSSNMKTHMKKCVKTKVRAVKSPCPGKAIAPTTGNKNRKNDIRDMDINDNYMNVETCRADKSDDPDFPDKLELGPSGTKVPSSPGDSADQGSSSSRRASVIRQPEHRAEAREQSQQQRIRDFYFGEAAPAIPRTSHATSRRKPNQKSQTSSGKASRGSKKHKVVPAELSAEDQASMYSCKGGFWGPTLSLLRFQSLSVNQDSSGSGHPKMGGTRALKEVEPRVPTIGSREHETNPPQNPEEDGEKTKNKNPKRRSRDRKKKSQQNPTSPKDDPTDDTDTRSADDEVAYFEIIQGPDILNTSMDFDDSAKVNETSTQNGFISPPAYYLQHYEV